jgi:hypothetical protein
MNERSIALFIHLLGVVTLFIAIGLLQRVGAALRAASSVEELRVLLSLARTTRSMFPAALLFIFASGLFMAARSFSFETPWIVVGIASVVVMPILGGAVAGRRLAAVGKGAASASSITPELARAIRNPAIWVALGLNSGLAIGVLWLMVAKPGWAQSIGVVIVLALVGAAAGYAATKSKA